MRRLLANNFVMCSVAFGFTVLGAVVAVFAQDFVWFSRFGSLVTCIGIVVISRPRIAKKDMLVPVVMDESGLTQLDLNYYQDRNEPVPDWVWEDFRSRQAVGTYGPVITLLGTVIWGFGDLLNGVFGF